MKKNYLLTAVLSMFCLAFITGCSKSVASPVSASQTKVATTTANNATSGTVTQGTQGGHTCGGGGGSYSGSSH